MWWWEGDEPLGPSLGVQGQPGGLARLGVVGSCSSTLQREGKVQRGLGARAECISHTGDKAGAHKHSSGDFWGRQQSRNSLSKIQGPILSDFPALARQLQWKGINVPLDRIWPQVPKECARGIRGRILAGWILCSPCIEIGSPNLYVKMAWTRVGPLCVSTNTHTHSKVVSGSCLYWGQFLGHFL